MSKTTSYYIYGNKIFIPSNDNTFVDNELSTEEKQIAELFKPSSYMGFGTDVTSTIIRNEGYTNIRFYYPKLNIT